MTLTIDTLGRGKQTGLILWNLIVSGITPSQVTLTVDGDVVPITVSESSSTSIRVRLTQATGDIMIAQFTFPAISIPPPVLPVINFIPYKCIATSTKEITVP